MRTKIRKRIGPAPIALVAVLALAAFISAGFWLVPGGANVTEAQSGGGPDLVPTADSGKMCGLSGVSRHHRVPMAILAILP